MADNYDHAKVTEFQKKERELLGELYRSVGLLDFGMLSGSPSLRQIEGLVDVGIAYKEIEQHREQAPE